MTYAELSPLMRAYLGTFATLRALGFESDYIYFEMAWSARFEVGDWEEPWPSN